MTNNRELLAREIVNRFVASISGTQVDTIVEYDPNDRIYVGKLSPQSESDSFSSSVLIKQISVNFRVPRSDLSSAELDIYPQGNFFFRIIPSYEEQKIFLQHLQKQKQIPLMILFLRKKMVIYQKRCSRIRCNYSRFTGRLPLIENRPFLL